MKKIIHRSSERGLTQWDWLKSYHSFSFGDYFDQQKMGFGALRVLNDDVIDPGKGFDTHGHRNMEIITIILCGSVKHQDSAGHQGKIAFGEVQVMSAGSGVYHSEFNASSLESLELLQIWIEPKILNIKPRYEQKHFDFEKKNKIVTFVGPQKGTEMLWINQMAWLSIVKIEAGEKVRYDLNELENGVYLFVVNGKMEVLGEILKKRDALGVTQIDSVEVNGIEEGMILIIEVLMNG